VRLINKAGATSVQHPVHGSAQAGPGGVFSVSTELGQALLEADRYHWTTEAEHAAEQTRDALADLADPRKAPQVMHDLLTRSAALEHRVGALEAELRAAQEAHRQLAASLGEPLEPAHLPGYDQARNEDGSWTATPHEDPEPDGNANEPAADPEAEPKPHEEPAPKQARRPGPDRPPATRGAAKKTAAAKPK
jgi:hypothetical protein